MLRANHLLIYIFTGELPATNIAGNLRTIEGKSTADMQANLLIPDYRTFLQIKYTSDCW